MRILTPFLLSLISTHLLVSLRRTADDIVGRVVVTLKNLMSEPNKIHERVDHLSGLEDADAMPGEIHWSAGYFEKVYFRAFLSTNTLELTISFRTI